jgi:hypothetical protein
LENELVAAEWITPPHASSVATVCAVARAVIEIVAAEEILAGLALAAMPRDDEARHHLEHFADAR